MKYTILLVAPLFFLLAYYLTIGRKNYLTLDEMDDDHQGDIRKRNQ